MMSTEAMENNDSRVDLMPILRGVVSSVFHLFHVGIALVIVCALLLCLRAGTSHTPVYQASASFAVRVTNPLYSSQQYYNASAAEQMADTFPSILTSGVLSQRVKQTLGIEMMPSISASVLGSTNIFTLTVTATDPQMAYDVLHCVMEIYPDVAEFVVGPTQLTLLDDTGVPTAPVNPLNLTAAAVKGAVLGGAAWFGLALLYWLTHQTVTNEKELRRLINLPCLCTLPMAAGYSRRKKQDGPYPRVSEANDKFGFSESVRLLRVRVEKQMAQRGAKVLMVTSTIANEGKTTVSMNLATDLARKGKKTLLVDCDLRNPSVAGALDVAQQSGLAEFLRGDEKIGDILRSTDDPNLFVIYGGSPVHQPQRMLASAATRNFLNAVRSTFDYVILDTPPCTMMADAAEVGAMADCTLLTVRQNFACRSQIVEGVQLLGDSGKPIIGCVMNMTTVQPGKKGYSYSYYGYYGK